MPIQRNHLIIKATKETLSFHLPVFLILCPAFPSSTKPNNTLHQKMSLYVSREYLDNLLPSYIWTNIYRPNFQKTLMSSVQLHPTFCEHLLFTRSSSRQFHIHYPIYFHSGLIVNIFTSILQKGK